MVAKFIISLSLSAIVLIGCGKHPQPATEQGVEAYSPFTHTSQNLGITTLNRRGALRLVGADAEALFNSLELESSSRNTFGGATATKTGKNIRCTIVGDDKQCTSALFWYERAEFETNEIQPQIRPTRRAPYSSPRLVIPSNGTIAQLRVLGGDAKALYLALKLPAFQRNGNQLRVKRNARFLCAEKDSDKYLCLLSLDLTQGFFVETTESTILSAPF